MLYVVRVSWVCLCFVSRYQLTKEKMVFPRTEYNLKVVLIN